MFKARSFPNYTGSGYGLLGFASMFAMPISSINHLGKVVMLTTPAANDKNESLANQGVLYYSLG